MPSPSARLGVGRLTLADPEAIELVNFNRQAAATIHALGRNKAWATAEAVRAIHPEVELGAFVEAVGPGNVDAVLEGRYAGAQAASTYSPWGHAGCSAARRAPAVCR